jgi:hypothetical protein
MNRDNITFSRSLSKGVLGAFDDVGQAKEVLAFLVGEELLSPEWAERLLSWRHTGFNVHSLVRTKTKPEAELVGEYMIRPLSPLEWLTFLEPEGKAG